MSILLDGFTMWLHWLLILAGFSLAPADNIYACNSTIYCQGRLLDTIQMAELFEDSKTFVDMNLKFDPETVEVSFNSIMVNGTPPKPVLQEFVDNMFDGPGTEFEKWTPSDYVENPAFLDDVKDENLKKFGKSLCEIWENLGRKIKQNVSTHQDRYSLLYVEKPFIVPGGRFRETYYWDSLWVVHGLLRCEMTQTVKGMLENFFSIINRVGLVPNGFRVYYTRRSQPPVLSWMVDSYFRSTGDFEFLQSALPYLEKEYQFWMSNRGTEITKGGKTYTLNQYKTIHNQPRPESYSEDVKTALTEAEAERPSIYSNLASAAESGWDFSSRWFSRKDATKMTLKDTVIKDIIPVDLNSILCRNEKLLSTYYNMTGDNVKYRSYHEAYTARKMAVQDVLWNPSRGVWQDYYIPNEAHRDYFFPSNVFPMYAECFGSTVTDIEETEGKVRKYLQDHKVESYPGGVPTSIDNTGQQWDLPNAWPPLQHVIITSLAQGRQSQSKDMAKRLAQIWVYTNWLGWNNTQHMFEKYDVDKVGRRGGGGEYGVQTGFGWTNGVVLDLLSQYGSTLSTAATTSASTSTSSSTYLTVLTCLIYLLVSIR